MDNGHIQCDWNTILWIPLMVGNAWCLGGKELFILLCGKPDFDYFYLLVIHDLKTK